VADSGFATRVIPLADPVFKTSVFPLAMEKTSMSKLLDTCAQADGEHILQRPVDEQRIPKNTEASILDLPLPEKIGMH
jgi:hypothetical protein